MIVVNKEESLEDVGQTVLTAYFLLATFMIESPQNITIAANNNSSFTYGIAV